MSKQTEKKMLPRVEKQQVEGVGMELRLKMQTKGFMST